jgi:hypothetical protein
MIGIVREIETRIAAGCEAGVAKTLIAVARHVRSTVTVSHTGGPDCASARQARGLLLELAPFFLRAAAGNLDRECQRAPQT